MPRPAALVRRVVKAYDVRGLVGTELDEDFAADVGAAFARLMAAESAAGQIVVGHDMRESSPALSAAFAAGVTGQGLDVVRIGLASTDELYFASGRLDCPGAMFTASHNPASYNGIKLCRAGAKPVGEDTGLAVIRQELIDGVAHAPDPERRSGRRGEIVDRDVLADYGEFLRSLVTVSGWRPLRVAVDAGNGMAGHTAPAVFGPIESLTVLPLYFELDGSFPNHEANPLEPSNLIDLQRYVVASGADIGLAFDGDADRCFVVDERGEPVSPSAVTALVAARELAREPGAAVIHNLITSRTVPEVIAENGGSAVRSRVGHSYIKALMAQTGAIFGGEHSAHYYFRDFWGADSGMLAALHVLAALGQQEGGQQEGGQQEGGQQEGGQQEGGQQEGEGQNRPLSELMRDYQRYAASGEINFRVDDAPACVRSVLDSFAAQTVSTDDLDGVTVDLGEGAWFNLRTSNTEPLLRLNVEAPTAADVAAIVERAAEQIAGARV